MPKREKRAEAARRVEPEFIRRMMRGEIEPIYPPRLDDMGLGDEDPADIIDSICGVDDSQEVEQYDGTLGVSVAFVAQHERPVGLLQWNDDLAAIYNNPGNVSGASWCTGTLISNNLFITAGHCFDQNPSSWTVPRSNGTMNPISPQEIATNMHVNFNYQLDPAGNLRAPTSYGVAGLTEYRLGGIDFAIVQLEGDPGATWGTTEIDAADAAIGDMLCIIQHPAGLPKRIEAGPLSDFAGSTVLYNDIDTLGGSSGSGILGPTGKIVGIHTHGGCDEFMSGHNFGQRISAVRAASPTIQSLPGSFTISKKLTDDPRPIKKVVDDPRPIKKLRDDPVVSKKLRDDRRPIKKVADDPRRPIGGFPRPDPVGPRPFILATPHHALTGVESAAGVGAGEEELQQQWAAYQEQLQQLEAAIAQGIEDLGSLQRARQELLAEYESLAGPG